MHKIREKNESDTRTLEQKNKKKRKITLRAVFLVFFVKNSSREHRVPRRNDEIWLGNAIEASNKLSSGMKLKKKKKKGMEEFHWTAHSFHPNGITGTREIFIPALLRVAIK